MESRIIASRSTRSCVTAITSFVRLIPLRAAALALPLRAAGSFN
jgi:hypothetical protein